MSSQMKLVFFGTADFSAPALEALLANDFNVVAVVTKPDKPGGRGRKIILPKVKEVANDHGIKVFQPTKLSEALPELEKLSADAGVVVAYGKIIPQSVIDLFPKGIINVHASLLPKYRGPSPIEAAILSGDAQTGISLMQIVLAMDAGPVFHLEPLKLDGSETKPQLYKTLSQLGAKTLIKHLPDILSGKLQAKPQVESDATYCQMIKKEDGRIDWNKPAEILEQEIRAYQGWPGSYTQLAGKDVIITAAHTADEKPDQSLAIECGDGKFLVIDRIKPAGKAEMSAKQFLSGYSVG